MKSSGLICPTTDICTNEGFMVEKSGDEKSGIEKSGVEISGDEMSYTQVSNSVAKYKVYSGKLLIAFLILNYI